MVKKIVRSNLKKYMGEMTQKLGFEVRPYHLAKATGLRSESITRWLSDEPLQKIDPGVLTALCDYFGCTPNDMLITEEVDDQEAELATHG